MNGPGSFRRRLRSLNLHNFSREHSLILEETELMSKDKYLDAYEAFLDPYRDGATLAIKFYESSFKRIIEYFSTDAEILYPLFMTYQPALEPLIKQNISQILATLNDSNYDVMVKCIQKWESLCTDELTNSLNEEFFRKAVNLSSEHNFYILRVWFGLGEPHITQFLHVFTNSEAIKLLVLLPDFFKNIDYILRFVRDVLLFVRGTDFFKVLLKQTNTDNIIFELFLLESKSIMKTLMLDILSLMKEDESFNNKILESLKDGTLLAINRKNIPNFFETPTEDDVCMLEIINRKFVNLQYKKVYDSFRLSFNMLFLIKMEMCFSKEVVNWFLEEFNVLIYLLLFSDLYSIELGAYNILKCMIINEFLDERHIAVLLKEMYKIGRRHHIEKKSPAPKIVAKFSLVCRIFEYLRPKINESNEIVDFWERELIKDTLFLDDYNRLRTVKDDLLDRSYVNYVFEELFNCLPKSKFYQE